MPKTKILFISHSLYLFGAESCILSLIKGLDRDRFETAAVVPAEGPLKQKLDELGIRSHILPLEWWVKNEGRLLHFQNEIPLALDKLMRIIDQEQPDVIHSNTSVVCWGAVAAALAGVRHVWHIHEILNGHPSLEPILPLPLLYEAVNFLSDRVVAVSNSLRDELSGYIAPDKLRVVYNGVDYHEPPSPSTFRLELGVPPGRPVAVTVTSLQKYKGIDNLLAAAAKVVASDESIVFAIAGSGPPEAVASLKAGIRELNLEGRVQYLGYRTDIADILAGSDIFVLPSTKEAFPLVVLEAMSHGKPVVTTDCGGTNEMVLDGETGFVVPVQDPDSLALRILELSGDRARSEAMGAAAQRRYAASFTNRHYLANFTNLYQELAAREKPRLTARQSSLINAISAAYSEYLKTMRVIPKVEQELSYYKRQFSEVNSLLTQKQEALLASERERIQESREHAEKVLSLVAQTDARRQEELLQARESQLKLQSELADRDRRLVALEEELARVRELGSDMQARLDSKKGKLADLDRQLEQLEAEIVSTLELHAELGEHPERAAQIVSGNERLRLIRERLASSNELRTELEMKVLQHRTELAARDLRIAELEAALASAGETRVELEDGLRQKGVELADREARIGQIEEEVLRESRRVEEEIRTKGEAVQKQLAALQTAKFDLENRLREKTVELGQREQQARQIAEEVMQQSRTVEEKLGHQDQSILHLSGQLSATAEKLNRTEEELARLRADREREADSCRQSMREKEQRIEDLLNSLSWRITGPLRKTYDIIKGRK